MYIFIFMYIYIYLEFLCPERINHGGMRVMLGLVSPTIKFPLCSFQFGYIRVRRSVPKLIYRDRKGE